MTRMNQMTKSECSLARRVCTGLEGCRLRCAKPILPRRTDSRCAEDGAHLPFDWLFCDRGAIQGSAFAPRADGGPAPWASIHEDWRRPAIRPFCGFLCRRSDRRRTRSVRVAHPFSVAAATYNLAGRATATEAV